MVATDQADALDLGAHLQHGGAALDLQVLDQHHGVSVLQHLAVAVLDDGIKLVIRSGSSRLRPLKTTVAADIVCAIGVGVFQGALGAGGGVAHGFLS